MRVYNPFLSIFNPTNYNNRDINHLINMTKARTFFEYNQRKQIQVNDEVTLTIGSYEDLNFVYDIWANDEEAQMYKLSERQKKILDVLPEMTSDDAFKHIEWINNELKAQSRSYKKSLMDKEPFAKSIARELKCNVSTLKHDLDRVSDGTHKSLLEIGLVEKIQHDEHNSKSPNFYYKIKNEGNAFVHHESNVQDGKIKFAHSLNSSIVKQKIIIDLLLYANIIINERGIHALKIFCDNYKDNIDVEDYNHINTLLESFFNHIDYDEHTISLTRASSSDIMQMMDFKQEILNKLKNNDTLSHDLKRQKLHI